MTKEELEKKEKELIDRINQCINPGVNYNLINRAVHQNEATVLYSICMSNKINFLPVIIERHRKDTTSAIMVNQMIDFALAQPQFVKELSQEEIYRMITIPAGVSCSGQPKVITAAFKQLKALDLLANTEDRKDAAKKVFKTILNYDKLYNTQKKLAKIWEKYGSFEEVKELLPSLEVEAENCFIEEKKFNLITIDCSKIGMSLKTNTEQKKLIRAFEIILTSFKELERKDSILMQQTNVEENKIFVLFENVELAKRFKWLVDFFSQDAAATIEWTQVKSYKEFDPYFSKLYSVLTLNNDLSEKLELGEETIKNKKLKV